MAFAALIPGGTGTIMLNASTQYPEPGETVTVTATNMPGNADTATYAWSVNGAAVLSGTGKTALNVVAPAIGQAETVAVTVTDASGAFEGAAETVINPAAISIVWEGNTTVPPFYIGRPLPNGASSLTLLAVPHVVVDGAAVPASSLVYTWSVNGVPQTDISGYGKDAATLTPPFFAQPFTVSVHAETADGRGGADGSAQIAPQTATALIYENAPLLGIRLERAVTGTFPMTETEASFTAFPLFVQNMDTLSYQWTLDTTPFTVDAARPRYVTFRRTGSGGGARTVNFSFTNPSGFLEKGSASFTLQF